MRIELQFQYTIDDVRDALKPEPRGSRGIRSSPRWQLIMVSILALPALTAVLVFGLSGAMRNMELLPPVRDALFLLGSSFLRARETDISLLLHDEEGRVHIIPKRAFADEIELARGRWMIEQHVKNVQFQPQRSAFPVVTASQSS